MCQNNFAEAYQSFKQAVESDPTNTSVSFNNMIESAFGNLGFVWIINESNDLFIFKMVTPSKSEMKV